MSGALARLAVVVTSWNTKQLLDACLRSLAAAQDEGAQVLVVDDASSDGSAQLVAETHPGVTLIACSQGLGYAAATNRGVAACDRAYVLLLNADTEVRSGALEVLLTFLETHPGHGAAAPRLLNPDGTTQHACMDFPRLRTPWFCGTPLQRWRPDSPELERYFVTGFDHQSDADVPQPPAAALMIRKGVWDELGGFDEDLPLFFGDVDLCQRLRASGRAVRFLAASQVLHHGGASTRQLPDFVSLWHRDRLTYFRKHHGRAAGWWVKSCTAFAWADHVLGSFRRRLRGEPVEPLGPLCRSFGAFLLS